MARFRLTFGLNILGDRPVDWSLVWHVYDTWAAIGVPPPMVVMNNQGRAIEAQARYPGATVIAREWPDDTIQDRQPNAAAWVTWMHERYPPPIVLYAGNEPRIDRYLAEWTIRAVETADALNRRLAVFNLGTGSPEDYHILDETGQGRDVLRPALEAVYRSNVMRLAGGRPPHLLGLHQYWDEKDPQADGYDPAHLRPGGDPDNPLDYDNWLIDRHRRLWYLAERAGMTYAERLLPVCATEFGADSSRYQWARGWRMDCCGVPPMTPEQAAAAVVFCDSLYRLNPDGWAGQTWFCISAPGHGWETYDLSGPDGQRVLRLLTDHYRAMAKEAEMDTWKTKLVTSTAVAGTNLRSGPGTGYPVVRKLVYNEPVTVEVSDSKTVGDGYAWLALRWPGGQILYGAEQYLRLQDVPQAPPLEPPPEPEPEPEPLPEEPGDVEDGVMVRLAAIEARLAEVEANLTTAIADLGNLRAVIAQHYRAGIMWLGEGAEAVGGLEEGGGENGEPTA